MKRGALMTIVGLSALLLLAACMPSPMDDVAFDVRPTILSVRTDQAPSIVIEGRYFGDGTGDSYVLVGANTEASGAVRADVIEWSPRRIVVSAPAEALAGQLYVVAYGRPSNPMFATSVR